MDGIWIGSSRPQSKKEVKEMLKTKPELVRVERTGITDTRPSGRVTEVMKVGEKVNFVGPDPYRNRKFYGVIIRTEKGWSVS